MTDSSCSVSGRQCRSNGEAPGSAIRQAAVGVSPVAETADECAVEPHAPAAELARRISGPLGDLINNLQAALWSVNDRGDVRRLTDLLQNAAHAAQDASAIVHAADAGIADGRGRSHRIVVDHPIAPLVAADCRREHVAGAHSVRAEGGGAAGEGGEGGQ